MSPERMTGYFWDDQPPLGRTRATTVSAARSHAIGLVASGLLSSDFSARGKTPRPPTSAGTHPPGELPDCPPSRSSHPANADLDAALGDRTIADCRSPHPPLCHRSTAR